MIPLRTRLLYVIYSVKVTDNSVIFSNIILPSFTHIYTVFTHILLFESYWIFSNVQYLLILHWIQPSLRVSWQSTSRGEYIVTSSYLLTVSWRWVWIPHTTILQLYIVTLVHSIPTLICGAWLQMCLRIICQYIIDQDFHFRHIMISWYHYTWF